MSDPAKIRETLRAAIHAAGQLGGADPGPSYVTFSNPLFQAGSGFQASVTITPVSNGHTILNAWVLVQVPYGNAPFQGNYVLCEALVTPSLQAGAGLTVFAGTNTDTPPVPTTGPAQMQVTVRIEIGIGQVVTQSTTIPYQ